MKCVIYIQRRSWPRCCGGRGCTCGGWGCPAEAGDTPVEAGDALRRLGTHPRRPGTHLRERGCTCGSQGRPAEARDAPEEAGDALRRPGMHLRRLRTRCGTQPHGLAVGAGDRRPCDAHGVTGGQEGTHPDRAEAPREGRGYLCASGSVPAPRCTCPQVCIARRFSCARHTGDAGAPSRPL